MKNGLYGLLKKSQNSSMFQVTTVRNNLKKTTYRSYKLEKSNGMFPHISPQHLVKGFMKRSNNDNNYTKKNITCWLNFRRSPRSNAVGHLLGSNIIRLFLLEGTINTEKNIHLLRYRIISTARNLKDIIWGQQYGCPAHNVATIRE